MAALRVIALVRDLMALSRIDAAATDVGAALTPIDDPAQLPAPTLVDLVLVDWGDRRPGWGRELARWRDAARPARPRLVLFGPHVDLEAHAEARQHGIGPMLARGRLFSTLPRVLDPG